MVTFITFLLLLAGIVSLIISFFKSPHEYDGLDGFFQYYMTKIGLLVVGITLCWYSLNHFGLRIIFM
jgi:hypothetical protein